MIKKKTKDNAFLLTSISGKRGKQIVQTVSVTLHEFVPFSQVISQGMLKVKGFLPAVNPKAVEQILYT